MFTFAVSRSGANQIGMRIPDGQAHARRHSEANKAAFYFQRLRVAKIQRFFADVAIAAKIESDPPYRLTAEGVPIGGRLLR